MKKFASILTASALILALLVGCGGNQAPAGSGSSPAVTNTAAGPKTQITFMVIDSFTKNEDDAIFTAEKEFEAANLDIDVVIEPVPATNIKDKFTNAALAGGGPDIVSLDTGGWIVDAAAIGILLDVSDRITPIRDQFQPGPIEAGIYNGQCYAVPWYLNNSALYYNNSILREAGLEKPPATWDEFADALEKISSTGKKCLSTTITAAYSMYPFFFQNGCDVIDTSGELPISVLDTPEALEAFTFFTDIHTKYNGFPESTKDALTWDQVYAPFIQGEVAFMICGDWGYNAVAEGNPELDFGIAPLPKGKSAASVMGGYSLCINQNTANADAAWKFVEFLTSAEQNDVLLDYGRIGARVDIDSEALIEMMPYLETFVEQAAVTYPRPGIKALADADNIFGTAFQEVYLGNADPEQALLKAHEEINALLQEKYA